MRRCDNPAVVVDRVSKSYEVGKTSFLQKKDGKVVHALSDVTFVVERGESIGILGRNGSGKSTLMRLISGAEQPSEGRILVSSQPTLLSVAAALRPDLTGLQNIRIGLLAQGVNPADIAELESGIRDFAGIGEAIYRPMRTYSSGMGARLRFAIATAVQQEILLVDEALATGDAAFKSRARDRMNGHLNGAGTIFLVSHSLKTMQEICTRLLWLNDGSLISDGEPQMVSDQYRRWSKFVAKGDATAAQRVVMETRGKYRESRIHLSG